MGAGTAPYNKFLTHLNYISHDFGEYSGEKLGGGTEYAAINIKSDITSIPLTSASIDYVICTEVLEHVPAPILALGEIARLLKKDGILILTAPMTGAIHQEPYHFYGGFSPYFFKYIATLFNLNLISLEAHGNYLRFLAQELSRLNGIYEELGLKFNIKSNIDNLKSNLSELANELISVESSLSANQIDAAGINRFSIGYWIILRKL